MFFFNTLTLLTIIFSTSKILAIPTSRALNRDLIVLDVETEVAPQSLAATTCSPEVTALASGISANIADQNNEVAAVSSLGQMLTESPVDATLFAAGQASLLSFVQKGISIRENNQKIAPAGNPAIPGLATVATAQLTELNLTMSLGVGGVNVARDNKTVTDLLGDFKGGIVQNMKNLQAAMEGCTTSGTGTATAPSKTSSAAATAKTSTIAKKDVDM
jgi:hypothetical protein